MAEMIMEIGYYILLCSISVFVGRATMKVKVMNTINDILFNKPTKGVLYEEGVMYACNRIYKEIFLWLYSI